MGIAEKYDYSKYANNRDVISLFSGAMGHWFGEGWAECGCRPGFRRGLREYNVCEWAQGIGWGYQGDFAAAITWFNRLINW